MTLNHCYIQSGSSASVSVYIFTVLSEKVSMPRCDEVLEYLQTVRRSFASATWFNASEIESVDSPLATINLSIRKEDNPRMRVTAERGVCQLDFGDSTLSPVVMEETEVAEPAGADPDSGRCVGGEIPPSSSKKEGLGTSSSSRSLDSVLSDNSAPDIQNASCVCTIQVAVRSSIGPSHVEETRFGIDVPLNYDLKEL